MPARNDLPTLQWAAPRPDPHCDCPLCQWLIELTWSTMAWKSKGGQKMMVITAGAHSREFVESLKGVLDELERLYQQEDAKKADGGGMPA